MFIIKKGSTRIVLITQNYVFKVTRLKFFWCVVRTILRLVFSLQWKKIPRRIGHDWHWHMRCLNANITEYRCWKATHAPFLVPTLFSLGILNVQKFEKGTVPTQQEVWGVLSQASKVSENHIYCIDPHCLDTKNFLKNDKGYRMVDYGDSREIPITISAYIMQWHKEIAPFFCST
jgi:hypothetical protein